MVTSLYDYTYYTYVQVIIVSDFTECIRFFWLNFKTDAGVLFNKTGVVQGLSDGDIGFNTEASTSQTHGLAYSTNIPLPDQVQASYLPTNDNCVTIGIFVKGWLYFFFRQTFQEMENRTSEGKDELFTTELQISSSQWLL